MKSQNRRRGHQFKVAISALGAAIMALTILIPASPAKAGSAAPPSLQPVGRLELEFDASKQQFIRVDNTGADIADTEQIFCDLRSQNRRKAGLLGLGLECDPDADPTPPTWVSFIDSPTRASIDEDKLAIGACRNNCTGTGGGQIDNAEILRIDFPSLVVADPSFQVEVKQDVAARVTYLVNDGINEREVGEFYLLSGRSIANPPPGIPENARRCEIRENPDGGNDSGNSDDDFCEDPGAPLHNAEEWEVLNDGLLSIKGGGEYPFPEESRTSWAVFEIEGFLDCGEQVTSEGGEVTVRRSTENVGGGCDALIGFRLAFVLGEDTQTVEWDVADPNNQNLGTIFDPIEFVPEPKYIDPPTNSLLSEDLSTILSYTDEVDCDTPPAMPPYHPPGVATRTCIGLQTCEGQPVRVCRSFGDGMPGNDSNQSCTTDEDCLTEGETCDLINLDPVTLPGGVFPDLVDDRCEISKVECTSDAQCTMPGDRCIVASEYGCVFDDRVLYLGATGSCSVTTSQSCSFDTECPEFETCQLGVEEIQKIQGIFLFDDARISRGR